MTTSLLAQAFASILIVLVLSIIAERTSPRIAGIFSGAPLGGLIVYGFLGHELGSQFVIDGIPYAIAGLIGTLSYIVGAYVVSVRYPKTGAVFANAVGVGVFFLITVVLRELPFGFLSALAATLLAMVATRLYLRRAPDVTIAEPIRLGFAVLVFRAGLASAIIVSVIAAGRTLGPEWSGLLVGFPMTLLPTLLIVHLTYSAAHTHAMVRMFPLGLGALVIFLASLWLVLPLVEFWTGIAVSLAGAIVYLTVLSLAAAGLGPREGAAP